MILHLFLKKLPLPPPKSQTNNKGTFTQNISDTRISQVLKILKLFDEVGAWNLEWTNP